MEKPAKTPKPASVPRILFESEMARQERHIKRLVCALIIAILACVAITGGFLLYLNQYDFESYEYQQDGEGVNIIGNLNGVDYNGAAGESKNP